MTWEYQTDDVLLLVYTDGDANFPDDTLVQLYLAAKRDRLIETVFPGQNMTMASFVAFLSKRPIILGVEKATNVIMGAGWLNEVEGSEGARKASLGFMMFRKFWGKSELRKFARLGLKWWFQETKIDVLFGFTLKTNLAAQAFSRELGFQFVADLPNFYSRHGHLVAARCLMLPKEAFMEAEANVGRAVAEFN